MPNSSRNTARTILNRIDDLWAALRAKHPEQVDELQRLLRLQDGADSGKNKPLAGMSRQPSTAVMLLVTELDKAISKADIFTGLTDRGYPCTSSAEKGLVNDAVNRLVKSGELVSHGGERSAQVVSLPHHGAKKASK